MGSRARVAERDGLQAFQGPSGFDGENSLNVDFSIWGQGLNAFFKNVIF